MTTKNKQGEVMEIHPEAVKLLNHHRGTDFRPGGEHYVENLIATTAISEALHERDEARSKLAYVRDDTTKELVKNGVVAMRTQVAAMRDALERELSGVETDIRWAEDDELGALIARRDRIKSALKDQSNDH